MKDKSNLMTATKELIIELRVALSGDMFEDAATITRAGDLSRAMSEQAKDTLGQNGYTLTIRTHSSALGRGRPKKTKTEMREDEASFGRLNTQRKDNGSAEQPDITV